MSAYERRKGADGEREAAGILRGVFPEARRRCSGEESQLVDQGRDLAGTPGFAVQVAVGARPPIYRKLEEAEGAAASGEIAVALTKRTRGPWLVTLRADDFLVLARLATSGARAASPEPAPPA